MLIYLVSYSFRCELIVVNMKNLQKYLLSKSQKQIVMKSTCGATFLKFVCYW